MSALNHKIKIAWYGKHFGEEPVLVGTASQGSGTIFFSSCNLQCVFCQNYQISQGKKGDYYTVADLAYIMLELQQVGAININLVTPTIWWQGIQAALVRAKTAGLSIPVIWNSNAYESIEVIHAMAGLVDIYLPDYKYSHDYLAQKYSQAHHYVSTAESALKIMLEQVGHLVCDSWGLATRGVLVRHLILPNQLNNSLRVLDRLAALDHTLYISLMSQYQPAYQSSSYPELNRILNHQEYQTVFDHLVALGLTNGWVQELTSHTNLLPDFQLPQPFLSLD